MSMAIKVLALGERARGTGMRGVLMKHVNPLEVA